MSNKNIFKHHFSRLFILIFLSITTLFSITKVKGQVLQDIIIVIDDTVGVQADWDPTQNRYDPKRLHTDVTTVDLPDPGYYRINIKILYNSGDEQKNETFFMTVLSPEGTTISPADSNAGPYKVVFDDPGPRHTSWRDAGLFYFPQGKNTLQMHHVATIMDEYPELLNGPFGESESVKVPDSLKLVPEMIKEKSVDLSISLKSKTDSVIIVDSDSINITTPGGNVQYTLTVFNHSPNSAKNVTLTNLTSQYFNVENINLNPKRTSGDSLIWEFSSLPPRANFYIEYDGTVDTTITDNDSLLIAHALIHAANDTTSYNNSASDTVLIKFLPKEPFIRSVDLGVSLISETDSVIIVDSDSINITTPGGNVQYTLTVFNHSPDSARDVLLINLTPRFIDIENISINPKRVSGDSLVWEFPSLPPLSDIKINYSGKVPMDIPLNEKLLIARAHISSSNDTTTNNNEAIDTVLVKFPTDFAPKIEATPLLIDVTDSIQIRIQIPEDTKTWDLWIHRPDGIVDKNFADQFITSIPVTPNIWYEIDQRYTPSWLITTEKEEQLIFEIHTYDFFNNEKTAQAAVTVRSSNYLVLDRNVFRPEAEEPLGIRFKLSNRRIAQLDIYDISGRHILKITEDVYEGGWNTYSWNGMTQDGQKVGGGVYLVTLRSGEFNSWKKFILVR